MTLKDLCEEEKAMKITQLIGLGETQRRIYECLEENEALDKGLKEIYKLHQEELELLIKYQKENNSL